MVRMMMKGMLGFWIEMDSAALHLPHSIVVFPILILHHSALSSSTNLLPWGMSLLFLIHIRHFRIIRPSPIVIGRMGIWIIGRHIICLLLGRWL
jgi:hypothetical protein